jgi:hypothetical protein
VTSVRVLDGRLAAARPLLISGWAGAVAAALAVVAAAAGWKGADVPNYLFRVELFRRAGFTIWSLAWYGGHHTPGYSVLLPPLAAAAGPVLVGAASATVAAVCFDRLLRRLPVVEPRRVGIASALFAVGTVVNLAVGRLAFALGLALGLAALTVGRRTAPAAVVSAGLSAVTTLASPVAGCFLALAWLAVAIAERRPRVLAWAALSLAPAGVLAVLFPEGGHFPFHAGALAATLAACLGALLLLPPQCDVLRIGAALYAAATLATFAVPNAMGANITRLGMFVALPLLVAVPLRRRRGIPAAAIIGVGVLLAWWQWSPAIDAMARSGNDASTEESFYAPLLAYLRSADPAAERIEIPFTKRHYEAVHVAPEVPLARGWQRQLDMKLNPLFYEDDGLDAGEYERWLYDTGVDYVALPDAELDASAEEEVALLERGQPGLGLVWQSDDWTVWRVLGGPGLVDGPATLVEQTVDTMTLRAWSDGTILVRVRPSDWWSVDGAACIAHHPDDEWVRIEVERPGPLVLRQVLVGQRGRCPS